MNDWQKRAEALRALLCDATAGEWRLGESSVYRTEVKTAIRSDEALICSVGNLGATSDYKPAAARWKKESPANAALIVAAVNALPDLLDQLDALTAERDRLIVERDAAYRAGMERAAGIVRDVLFPRNPVDDWTDYARTRAEASNSAVKAILDRAASIGAGDDGWRPIESAPKDREEVLLSDAVIVTPAKFINGCWAAPGYAGSTVQFHPTHWRPLPPAPAATDPEGALHPPVRSQKGS